MATMYQNIQKTNFQSAKAQVNVQSVGSMEKMVSKKCWDAQFVETTNRILKTFDL